MLKNSLTLVVSVLINISIRLTFGFVFVNGPRTTSFVDALRRNPKMPMLTLLVPRADLFSFLLSAEKRHALRNQFFVFSSRKPTLLSGSSKHPHKYRRTVKDSIFRLL